MGTEEGRVFGGVAEALRMANAAMDYLSGPEAADLDACRVRAGAAVAGGEVAGEVRRRAGGGAVPVRRGARMTRTATARPPRGWGEGRHHPPGRQGRGAADAAVPRPPRIAAALAAADISDSWALAIAEWTRKLPPSWRETIKLLVHAAGRGGAGGPGGSSPAVA